MTFWIDPFCLSGPSGLRGDPGGHGFIGGPGLKGSKGDSGHQGDPGPPGTEAPKPKPGQSLLRWLIMCFSPLAKWSFIDMNMIGR